MVAEVQANWPNSLAVVVNNAGITADRTFRKMDEAQWHAVLDVNLNGAFNVIAETLPLLTAREHGCIVNISSVIAQSGGFGQANYAASKAALLGLTRSLALELARKPDHGQRRLPRLHRHRHGAVDAHEKVLAKVVEQSPIAATGPTRRGRRARLLPRHAGRLHHPGKSSTSTAASTLAELPLPPPPRERPAMNDNTSNVAPSRRPPNARWHPPERIARAADGGRGRGGLRLLGAEPDPQLLHLPRHRRRRPLRPDPATANRTATLCPSARSARLESSWPTPPWRRSPSPPRATHAPLAKAAPAAGKHVLVEKPLAPPARGRGARPAGRRKAGC